MTQAPNPRQTHPHGERSFAARYARFITRLRWPIVAFWLVVTAASMFLLPSLNKVVSHTQTTYLPNSSPVVTGQNLLKRVDPGNTSASTAVIAITNPHGLTAADKSYFAAQLAKVDAHRGAYGVNSVQDIANTDKSLASSFVSKDGTTEIALVGFPTSDVDDKTSAALTKLHTVFHAPPSDVKVYFTGDAPIQLDDMQISQSGVDKTAGITVALVLIILLLVFRSVIAPFVTLISIGLSFLITSGVVAWLAERGLPVSSFTQTFLIAVLFGAGTDYSIILMNRFREEMTREHGDKVRALADAVGAVSKTVMFSGATVLVSFAVLYFAKFGLYRSAVGVAIGVAITLITCLTLIPSLMSLLGPSMYWPRRPKPGASHKPSWFWTGTSRIAARRPWWTLLALCVVLIPIALLFTNDRTFNPMDDIPSAPSVSGFKTVSNAFGPGNVMPSQIVLKTSANLRTSAGLTTIENISNALVSLPSISQVDSATRPTGAVVADFQIANQNQQAAAGLGKVQNGLTQLQNQLGAAGAKVSGGSHGSANQLVSGSAQVTSGIQQLGTGLSSLSTGANKLANGASQAANGAAQLQTNLQKLASALQQSEQGASQLSQGLSQSATAANQLQSGTGQLSDAAQQLQQSASALANALAAWAQAHPDAQSDPQWTQIEQLAQAQQTGTQQLAGAAAQVNQDTGQLATGIAKLNTGATQLDQGLTQASGGASQLATGAGKVANGVNSVASGAASVSSGAGKMASSTGALASGSQQVTGGIQTLTSSLGLLSPGLNQAVSGIGQLNSGVSQVKGYLTSSSAAKHEGNPGFYVPASTVTSDASLLKAMNAYISPDGHVAKFTIVLTSNPYSSTAINDVPGIEHAAQVALQSSPVHTGTIYAAGTTPTQAALNQISTQDFTRTVALILIAIFILLVLMLRSIVTPVYIIMSLAGTYFVTMGLLQTLTLHVLHKPGLSWPVPFFVFLLLVALGVDYSIFLMSRYEEEMARGLSPRQAIQTAMGHMGNVIFSAALIMAGTFGSMIAAGVSSLVEIGMSVIIGLLLYFAVMLGFFVPAAATVLGRAHFWPFASERDGDGEPGVRKSRPMGEPNPAE
ncbi:MMPL family transporter [Alicyclobacillus cycloheptanicus]|uniref:RND superfamily putative drug exporter n=1 Tax=Alicyclobacillus cycloheptanicus TaxID=1457 RepID=A0ABT9XK37_9BACL|nr:MMPL family transporter [Alicyclobacillus cycloheptanicus]MDQ0190674.1 RND superfamily putative drug exporter [Alicyclobacillus cycloheptanicus]